MRIFTIESGRVAEGARVEKFSLAGAGVAIDAIVVGESGRGRGTGVLPVQGDLPLAPCPLRGSSRYWSGTGPCVCECGTAYVRATPPPDASPLTPDPGWVHPDAGTVPGPLLYADLGQTQAGRPKLVAAPLARTEREILVILRTRIGFRGGNSHTGDRHDSPCPRRGQKLGEYDYACPDCGAEVVRERPDVSGVTERVPGAVHPDSGAVTRYDPFPGRVLARGEIAQGAAGRMGGGEQLIAVVPIDAVFRTGYSGRLYGGPSAHYYKWDGRRLLCATWEERQLSDVF